MSFDDDDFSNVLQTLSNKIAFQNEVINQQKLSLKNKDNDFERLKALLLAAREEASQYKIELEEKIVLGEVPINEALNHFNSEKQNVATDVPLSMVDRKYNKLVVGDWIEAFDNKSNQSYYKGQIVSFYTVDGMVKARTMQNEHSLYTGYHGWNEVEKSTPPTVNEIETQTVVEATPIVDVLSMTDRIGKKIVVGDTVEVFSRPEVQKLVVKNITKMYGNMYAEFGNGFAVGSDYIEKVETETVPVSAGAIVNEGYISLLNPLKSWMLDKNGVMVYQGDEMLILNIFDFSDKKEIVATIKEINFAHNKFVATCLTSKFHAYGCFSSQMTKKAK